MKIKWDKYEWVVWVLLIIVIILAARCGLAHADTRVNLLTRLDTRIQDANNQMLDSTEKISILDEVGREFARKGAYIRLDTISLVVSTERYELNSDFAGTIYGAYIKDGRERTFLQVVDYEDLRTLPAPKDKVVYVYVAGAAGDTVFYVGVHNLPPSSGTMLLDYFAYPAALSADGIEWDLPDGLEGAALDLAAAKCYMTADLRPDMVALFYKRYLNAVTEPEAAE